MPAYGSGDYEHFYPRSPCGERQPAYGSKDCRRLFLSTLSLRRATVWSTQARTPDGNFYPRSPCGERRLNQIPPRRFPYHFYPRSPCGERPRAANCQQRNHQISIHALLAESDYLVRGQRPSWGISIHALLAESDGESNKLAGLKLVFLSTLSLRRATFKDG